MKPLILILAVLAAAPSAHAAGKVLSTTGTLRTGDRILKAGDALPDAEVTLASGTATLATDGGRFLLKGPARLTPRKKEFKLDLGGLLSVVDKRAHNRFAIRTPAVVAAVRGTDFYVAVGPTQVVDVCICNGALATSAKGMKKFPMTAVDHLNQRFYKTKTETVHEPSPMFGHTDEEIANLHSLLAVDKP